MCFERFLPFWSSPSTPVTRVNPVSHSVDCLGQVIDWKQELFRLARDQNASSLMREAALLEFEGSNMYCTHISEKTVADIRRIAGKSGNEDIARAHERFSARRLLLCMQIRQIKFRRREREKANVRQRIPHEPADITRLIEMR